MKLEYENNWELDIYRVGGVKVKNLDKVRINKVDYKVTAREVTVTYYDHGHQGGSRSVHYFVKEKVFGITKEFDLNGIIKHKPITVLKYELEDGRKF